MDDAFAEADAHMAAAQARIAASASASAARDAPWDGYCGLLQLCDDSGGWGAAAPPAADVASLDADVRSAVTAALRRAYAPAAALTGGSVAGDDGDTPVSAAPGDDPPAHPPSTSTPAPHAADFEAAARALASGDLDAAAALLRRAAAACPPSRTRAAERIARYLAAVEEKLERRERDG